MPFIKKLFIILILLAFLGGVLYIGGGLYFYANTPLKTGKANDVFFAIQKGTPPFVISEQLEKQELISSHQTFLLIGKITKRWSNLKVGEYKLSARMTPMEIFRTITSGKSATHPFTVPEGQNMYQIADQLEARGFAHKATFLRLVQDPEMIRSLKLDDPAIKNMEGYLYPETYMFPRSINEEEIIRIMTRQFLSHWSSEFSSLAKEHGFSRHQVLTLASIIEKETGAKSERALISSVFHNRLKKKTRLQSDPTIIYGIWHRYDGNLSKDDILEKTPYNTYTFSGLPPGPIGNPGVDAIEAVLKPARTDFLFFVSHNDGTHEFTSTLKDHNAAVKKFQLNKAAHTGKSWRDLNKAQNEKR